MPALSLSQNQVRHEHCETKRVIELLCNVSSLLKNYVVLLSVTNISSNRGSYSDGRVEVLPCIKINYNDPRAKWNTKPVFQGRCTFWAPMLTGGVKVLRQGVGFLAQRY